MTESKADFSIDLVLALNLILHGDLIESKKNQNHHFINNSKHCISDPLGRDKMIIIITKFCPFQFFKIK